jgi:hypothetical protein
MVRSFLQWARIEYYLDVCLLPTWLLSQRLPHPILVLEMTAQALQNNLFGLEATALDTDSVRALWLTLPDA